MTYNYMAAKVSPIYHILKTGRIYSLCGELVQWKQIISPEPPAGKKECVRCANVLRELTTPPAL